MTFNEWVKSKGVEKVAEKLEVRHGTVYSWVSRGVIPRSVWPDILVAFGEVGLSDLLAMEAASK